MSGLDADYFEKVCPGVAEKLTLFLATAKKQYEENGMKPDIFRFVMAQHLLFASIIVYFDDEKILDIIQNEMFEDLNAVFVKYATKFQKEEK